MTLVQSQDPRAALDRVVRSLTVHCGLRTDGLTAVEHAARAELAGRLLDAVDGDEAALDFGNLPGDEVTTAAFAAELTKLSVNKTLT
ncbi:MAG TPA: hypothetical protein VJ437_11140 [Acidiferrobacterales bacterium]|nr:hypothetical protein [Acidiferrobacterales bacterium]